MQLQVVNRLSSQNLDSMLPGSPNEVESNTQSIPKRESSTALGHLMAMSSQQLRKSNASQTWGYTDQQNKRTLDDSVFGDIERGSPNTVGGMQASPNMSIGNQPSSSGDLMVIQEEGGTELAAISIHQQEQ